MTQKKNPQPPKPEKTPQSAVVVIPPKECWEPIQAIRRRYDNKVERWMPHITLLYPFWARPEQERAVQRLRPALAALQPGVITLRELRFFPPQGRSGQFWLYLRPEPKELLVGLWEKLRAAVPELAPPERFEPHLSVGQVQSREEAYALLVELGREWKPLSFPLQEISLIYREKDGPFQVEQALPLGPA
jgi:2'-5' RNA ligase